jgi:siroheme synthase-like protein
MDVFPVSLDLYQRPCLVVGGGNVATRKVLSLLNAGAKVTVVSPEITAELQELHSDQLIRWENHPYRRGEVVGYWLVVCAVNSQDIQRVVFLDCERARIWVNSVDELNHSSFIFPATVKKGPITLSINTNGNSPFFAAWLANTLGQYITQEHITVLETLSSLRSKLKEKGYSTQSLNWSSLFNTDLFAAAKKGKDQLNQIINSWLADSGLKL